MIIAYYHSRLNFALFPGTVILELSLAFIAGQEADHHEVVILFFNCLCYFGGGVI